MDLSDDKKAELLYSHYSDTHSGIQQLIRSRDRFFIGVLALLAVMSFQIALPTESGNVIAEFTQKKLNIQENLSISFLGSVIWAALLFLSVRYFQVAVSLERQYRYIHALEEELSPIYSGAPFTREGKFYLAQYPWFSEFIARLYTWGFPVGLILAAILKLVSEFRLPQACALPLITDAAICLLLVAASVLYLLHIHLKK